MNLLVLQTVRLTGGMADATVVAEATGQEAEGARSALEALAAEDHVVERRDRYRVTPAGRDALDAALAAERDGLDAGAIAAIHEEFTDHNARFKQLVTDWQLRDGEPNDHGDAGYDEAVLARLDELHTGFVPLAERLATVVPRLERYPHRLAAALARVRAGESKYFINPMVDSYHQVWFELHEELIGAAGRDRTAEAAAGRAE